MTPTASPSLSSWWGSAASSMNFSRCRSNRGLSAKSTSARFSSALRSMREASDGSPPPWFMARSPLHSSTPPSAASGQWRTLLGPEDLDRYESRVRELATPDLAAWAHVGWRGYRKLKRANEHAEEKP